MMVKSDNRNRHVLFIVFMLLLACLITACNSSNLDLGDGGFLSNDSCSAHCFIQIIPGLTNENQAVQILKDKHYLANCVFNKESSESDTHGIVCYKTFIISIRNDNNIVDDVGFRPSKNITLGDVTKKYGDPDQVAIYIHEVPDWITLSLYYEKIQTRLDLYPQDGKVYLVGPSIAITNIAYFESTAFTNLIKQSEAQKWVGYGNYKK